MPMEVHWQSQIEKEREDVGFIKWGCCTPYINLGCQLEGNGLVTINLEVENLFYFLWFFLSPNFRFLVSPIRCFVKIKLILIFSIDSGDYWFTVFNQLAMMMCDDCSEDWSKVLCTKFCNLSEWQKVVRNLNWAAQEPSWICAFPKPKWINNFSAFLFILSRLFYSTFNCFES